jgi:hypothetical protein
MYVLKKVDGKVQEKVEEKIEEKIITPLSSEKIDVSIQNYDRMAEEKKQKCMSEIISKFVKAAEYNAEHWGHHSSFSFELFEDKSACEEYGRLITTNRTEFIESLKRTTFVTQDDKRKYKVNIWGKYPIDSYMEFRYQK